jgi:diguanylate cyclase (GGDEF)-like protein
LSSILAAERDGSLFNRLLPLRHWLGPEAGRTIEAGQARTRLICTFIGLCGFMIAAQFADLPGGIIGTAIVFPLYAVALALHTWWRPAPTHARRGIALLADNLIASYIASFGGAFAAYVGFNFLTTVGWGLRFGRHYLCLATAIALAGMAWNLVWSPYWQEHLIFGGSIIFGMVATGVNTYMLLGRIALGNRHLAEKVSEIEQLAWQDQLTRLPNRAHFQERLAQELAGAARSERKLAVLLFDIDGFKAVNDTLGHEAGDRLLQEIAQRVGRRIRQADTLARVGGDEFVVLMEISRHPADAVQVAETLNKVIAEIDIFADPALRVGASIGIASFGPGAGRVLTPADLLRAADRAMYAAKRAGKGCYRLAG